MLDMASLVSCVTLLEEAFVAGEDYVYMESPIVDWVVCFTYRGLLRCLFGSRKPVARMFISWAEKVLFAAHFGTHQQQEELAAALVGVGVDVVRQVARQVYASRC